jgi:DNA-binding beta-propeller fold protein YncE
MRPQGIAVDAAGRRAFVACSRGNAIAVVPLDGPAVPW